MESILGLQLTLGIARYSAITMSDFFVGDVRLVYEEDESMPYAYRCPWCGKSHHMDELLIDLAPVLTPEHSFQISTLYMTVGELKAIASQGLQPQKRKPWMISMDVLMSIIANQYNLNDPDVQRLTLQEINEYLDHHKKGSDHIRPSIRAMCRRIETIAPWILSDILLMRELEAIQELYHYGCPTIYLEPIFEGSVTTGFHLINKQNHSWLNNRLCPTCHRGVPERACTVPQKLVAFFGGILTSKTTTLLALTHYALNGSSPHYTHSIWKDTEKLPQVWDFALLDPSEDLRRDLDNYERGISPPKYPLRQKDLPVANLLITVKDGTQAILTLINPPGEVFVFNNQIDMNLLFREFPAVLSADLLIHCVSQKILMSKECVAELKCAQSLVTLLENIGNSPPVLTLFTDLDSDHPHEHHALLPDEVNMLQDEYADLQKNPLTGEYLRKASSFPRMRMDSVSTYRNAMRCHPLGCNTPLIYPHDNRGVEPIPPTPENIPLLMYWVLAATGILPAAFVHPLTGKHYYSQITRRQFRQKLPISQKEATARCILFQNPSQQDKAMAYVQDEIPTGENTASDYGHTGFTLEKDKENQQEPIQEKKGGASKTPSTVIHNYYYDKVVTIEGDVVNGNKHEVDKDDTKTKLIHPQTKLLADLVSCCEMLQDDNTTWDKSEDERTTYIRNLLRAKGYIANDQSRGGISVGEGEQAGELDLDIRLDNNERLTIFEALNLKGSAESYRNYWNAHLDKLLDNYNATGCPVLFHVTYLSCAKSTFAKHCAVFEDHVRCYHPEGFSLTSERPTDPLTKRGIRHGGFLRVMECVYDCGGIPMTVYHFFVRIGE